jgi:hypothetical protein
VDATTGPGTLLHEAIASSALNEWDEIILRALNTGSSTVQVTVEWGGTTASDRVTRSIAPGDGFVDVVPGHVLQGGAEVRAFADSAGAIVMHGFVNRYSQHTS